MPLTKDLLLVGQREGAPQFFPTLFNVCAAACSHEYFITSASTPENAGFAEHIGVWSRKFIHESLAELDKEYPSSPTPNPEPENISKKETINSSISYEVSFTEWNDESNAHLIADKVKPLVAHIAARYSLDLLDGMTFAMDYEHQLANMDRGYDTPPMRSASLGYGVGWSIPVDVLKNGIYKVRIVFRGTVGQLLLINDETGFRMAEQTVVFQVANVAFRGLVHDAFGDYQAPQREPWINAVRKDLMGYAISSYFAARESAAFNPENESASRILLTGAVDDARRIIMQERLSYRFHGDLDGFLGIVRVQVSPILKFAAELAGYMDGIDAPEGADDELKTLLAKVNLGTWFDQFRRDLRAQFAEVRRWESVEAFQEVNYHAERVLWAFGVFPWTTPDGTNRVDIPLVLDAHRLGRASLRRPLGLLRLMVRGIGRRITRFFRRA